MGKSTALCILVTVVFTALFSLPASASVTGTVTDTTGAPVSGATVTFIDESNPESYFIAYTDDSGRYEISLSSVSVAEPAPAPFTLHQNYPNPFNPATVIRFTLDKAGHIDLSIFNILGQQVKTLVNKHHDAGEYEIQWDGTDNSARAVSSGIYIYRMVTGTGYVQARKLVLMR